MLLSSQFLPRVLTALAFSALAHAQQRPQALENFQKARERLETGSVDYFWRQSGVGPPAGVYRTARMAGPDLIDILRGGPEENAQQTAEEEGARVIAFLPTLKRDGERWAFMQRTASAVHSTKDNSHCDVPDFRSLGATCFLSYADIHDTLWRDQGEQPAAREYTERIEDGLHVVTAKTEHGGLTWWIDPKRDWNAVRITAVHDGKTLRETRISLRQFDGVWYPDTVLNFNSGYKNGTEPAEVIRVVSASFNDPKHPRRFTPADIGIEPGMTIHRPLEPPGTPLLFFDGKSAIGEAEYRKKLKRGEVQPGPTLVRSWASAQAEAIQRLLDDTSAEKRHETIWAEYVRNFIVRYQLDAEQADKAILILHECEDRAREYVQRKKREFEELEKTAVARAQEATADPDKSSRLGRREAELMSPIHEIFEQQLKPRLEKLPTRAQQRAAEGDDEATKKEP